MIRIPQFVPTGLCAGLSLIIAAELLPVTKQNDSPAVDAAGSAAPLVETEAPAPSMEAMAAAILERPLFSPTRHPPEIVSLAETPEEAPRQLRGRLAGVMIRPGVREALFVRWGQKPIAVNVGSEIEGWRIAAIEPDRVILSSASGNRTIKPTHDPEALRPSAAGAQGNLGNRTARAGSPATPNPMRNPFQLTARTGRPGRR